MKYTITILLLLSACSKPPVTYTQYGDNTTPRWQCDNYQCSYCDSNFCADSVEQYHYFYKMINQPVIGRY